MFQRIDRLPLSATVFRLGDWLVEPRLNRLSRGDATVQLELKVMDVLLCLAENAGELVSKQELVDTVWQTEFVTDNTVFRRVAQLRAALGDDARQPRYVETIPKRGYRLIAEVTREGTGSVTPFPVPRQVAEDEDERDPYPGLAPFTERDAGHFFGREAEVAAMWRRLTSRRLLAVIGPSGAGKTSFLRAGVVAAAPEGWRVLVIQPGESPFVTMARALGPELAGDADAVDQLLRFDDPDVALAVVLKWRERWDRVLLVVDQFEELFTLNPPEVQSRFADLLRRLADAADVHVVLALRDDFLIECHNHPPLAPVFSELTPLATPRGETLRRALSEPAARAGFAFSDDELLSDMMAEVEGERGALPLLAFALARLWQLRDLERKLLTREAYQEIGGVSGALARHADATLEAVGEGGIPVVRELFRNLITAKGTRATRDADELLTVFGEEQRERAAEVLRALVAARLLTSFKVAAGADEGQGRRRRVEIIHESLLGSWPLLERWRAQDADAAQLRDQLRQAAQLWHQRGRPPEMLWTGSPFREYQLWRERYAGGLTATERAFARAMEEHAGRTRRRRRVIGTAVLLVSLAVAAVTTGLWRRSAALARHAEARQLLHRGQLALETSPERALGWAMASLELEDDPEVRLLALDALWQGPVALVARKGAPQSQEVLTSVAFSPDGRWLATAEYNGRVALWPAAGGDPTVWQAHDSLASLWFAPDSTALLTAAMADPEWRLWSVPDGAPLGTQPIAGWAPATEIDPVAMGNDRRLVRLVRAPGGGWQVDPQREELRQWLAAEPRGPAAVDEAGEVLVYARDGQVFCTELDDWPGGSLQRIGHSQRPLQQMALHPSGDRVATVDVGGAVRLWSLSRDEPSPLLSWDGEPSVCFDLRFDPSGRYLVSGHGDGMIRVRGLDDPPGAAPHRFVGHALGVSDLAFHPQGRWLAAALMRGLGLFPFEVGRYGHALEGHLGSIDDLAFAPDGSYLVSTSADGTVRLWPLVPTAGERSRVLVELEPSGTAAQQSTVAVSPDGQWVAVASARGDAVRLVPVGGGPPELLLAGMTRANAIAIDSRGLLVAAGGGSLEHEHLIRVWNLETGETTLLDVPDGQLVTSLAFTAGGDLLSTGGKGLYRWDLETAQPELLQEDLLNFVLAPGGDRLLGAMSGGWLEFTAALYDFDTGSLTPLPGHGSLCTRNTASYLALDPSGSIVITAGGTELRVGPASGQAPHLLLGHDESVYAVAVSSDGRWIASGSRDGVIRLWPMPDVSREPLHALPRAELLARLEALVTLRYVPSQDEPGSYDEQRARFPGWETVPTW